MVLVIGCDEYICVRQQLAKFKIVENGDNWWLFNDIIVWPGYCYW